MRDAQIRGTSQAKRLLEHLILLAFMTLTSSILMRAGGNTGDVVRQSLIWLAAGEILIQFLTRRRVRTRLTRVVSRRPIHVRRREWPGACQPL